MNDAIKTVLSYDLTTRNNEAIYIDKVIEEIVNSIKTMSGKDIATLYNREFSKGCILQYLEDSYFKKIRIEGKNILDNKDFSHEPHIRVEFDLNHWGGDYSHTGDFVFIPQSVYIRYGIDTAFQAITHYNPQHIIQYDEDELYTYDGNFYEGESY